MIPSAVVLWDITFLSSFLFSLPKNCRLPPLSAEQGVPGALLVLGPSLTIWRLMHLFTKTDLVFPPDTLCHGEEGLFPKEC